jgi:hypothetical protein
MFAKDSMPLDMPLFETRNSNLRISLQKYTETVPPKESTLKKSTVGVVPYAGLLSIDGT